MVATEFKRYVVYMDSDEGRHWCSGKEHSVGPTRVMWNKDPSRARLFKRECDAEDSMAYRPECGARIGEVTVSFA